MNRVVVTGAAGFLGSHVADHLERSGFEVVRSDIVEPVNSPNSWKLADLTNTRDVMELTRAVDVICHLGGIGDVYEASKNPALAMKVNGYGTANLLNAAMANQVRRVVVASSWEVYGAPTYQPVDEAHPCKPTHPYSISKLACDLISQSFNHHSGFDVVVLRLGTAYGLRIRKSAVIPSFLLRALRQEPIEIHGTGHQFRQFTHATDIASAFSKALGSETPSPVYNIVSPEEVTIKSIAEAIAARIPVEILYRDSRRDDPVPVHVDSTLADKELGWRPRISFGDGLTELIDGFIAERQRLLEMPP